METDQLKRELVNWKINLETVTELAVWREGEADNGLVREYMMRGSSLCLIGVLRKRCCGEWPRGNTESNNG